MAASFNNSSAAEPWIELTDPKEFSRLLYTNPVCFLSTFNPKNKQRNVMTFSWLAATNNVGGMMCSMNKRRFTASLLTIEGVSEFVLSVPVQGMENLVRDVGAVSGQFGSKFPSDHDEVDRKEKDDATESQEKHMSKRKLKNKRKRELSAMGIPGLEAVPFGSQTPASTTNDEPSQHQAFAIRGTVAHLKCNIYKIINNVIDDEHLLIMANITAAHVHPSYWDAKKSRFRPLPNVPKYLTFFGSQEFGYVVTQTTDENDMNES